MILTLHLFLLILFSTINALPVLGPGRLAIAGLALANSASGNSLPHFSGFNPSVVSGSSRRSDFNFNKFASKALKGLTSEEKIGIYIATF
jgi:hypothetical protein